MRQWEAGRRALGPLVCASVAAREADSYGVLHAALSSKRCDLKHRMLFLRAEAATGKGSDVQTLKMRLREAEQAEKLLQPSAESVRWGGGVEKGCT
jgi:hypothetical protein